MILCLTGLSCIGKTTVSKLLTEENNYTLLSMRKISHDLAIKHGYSRTRDWLKETSIKNYLSACRKAILLNISKDNSNYVIDDLFDIELWNEINSEYNSTLISFSLPDEIRIARMQKRENLNFIDAQKELSFLDNCKKAFGIEKVINNASAHLEVSNLNPHEIMQLIHQYI